MGGGGCSGVELRELCLLLLCYVRLLCENEVACLTLALPTNFDSLRPNSVLSF